MTGTADVDNGPATSTAAGAGPPATNTTTCPSPESTPCGEPLPAATDECPLAAGATGIQCDLYGFECLALHEADELYCEPPPFPARVAVVVLPATLPVSLESALSVKYESDRVALMLSAALGVPPERVFGSAARRRDVSADARQAGTPPVSVDSAVPVTAEIVLLPVQVTGGLSTDERPRDLAFRLEAAFAQFQAGGPAAALGDAVAVLDPSGDFVAYEEVREVRECADGSFHDDCVLADALAAGVVPPAPGDGPGEASSSSGAGAVAVAAAGGAAAGVAVLAGVAAAVAAYRRRRASTPPRAGAGTDSNASKAKLDSPKFEAAYGYESKQLAAPKEVQMSALPHSASREEGAVYGSPACSPPGGAAAEPPLPPGWSTHYDDASACWYYAHESGDSSWTRPVH